jgi:hypothetical protein
MARLQLAIVLAFGLASPACAQQPAATTLHLGPLPNPGGVVTKVPKDFADSYADLRKAHDKARPSGVELVDDATQADAVLTVTFRGQVDAGTTIGESRGYGMPPTLNIVAHATRTLRARLTVHATGEGVDFSGVATGDDDRTKWSAQAARIYSQAVAWLQSNRARLKKNR